MKQVPQNKVRKILCIRPDNVGDIVFATALLRGLKENLPHATISVLLKENALDLVTNHPFVNEVILDWYSQGKVQNKEDEKRYVEFLKEKKFDVAINLLLHENRYADLARWAQIPYRLGDKSILAQSWKYNYGVYLDWKDLSRHEIEYLFDLVKPLGIPWHDEKIPKMVLASDPEKQVEIAKKLEINGWQTGASGENLLIAIHPGTSGGNKPWHPEGFAKLIQQLHQSYGAKILLTGGKDEATLTQTIAEQAQILGTPPNQLLDLGGKLSLSELTALFTHLSLYIGGDTGPTHIASALGIPVLDLFPSKQKKPARWAPWGTRHAIIKPISECPEPCHPRICPLDICQKEIRVDKVWKEVQWLLSGGGLVSRSETLYDWCKKTFNVLWMVGNIPKPLFEPWKDTLKAMHQEGFHIAVHSEQDQPLLTVAQDLGVPTYCFPIRPSQKIIESLFKLIVKEDINLFHYLFRRNKLTETVVRHLAALKIPNPPLALHTDGPTLNPKSLFEQYLSTFRKTLHA